MSDVLGVFRRPASSRAHDAGEAAGPPDAAPDSSVDVRGTADAGEWWDGDGASELHAAVRGFLDAAGALDGDDVADMLADAMDGYSPRRAGMSDDELLDAMADDIVMISSERLSAEGRRTFMLLLDGLSGFLRSRGGLGDWPDESRLSSLVFALGRVLPGGMYATMLANDDWPWLEFESTGADDLLKVYEDPDLPFSVMAGDYPQVSPNVILAWLGSGVPRDEVRGMLADTMVPVDSLVPGPEVDSARIIAAVASTTEDYDRLFSAAGAMSGGSLDDVCLRLMGIAQQVYLQGGVETLERLISVTGARHQADADVLLHRTVPTLDVIGSDPVRAVMAAYRHGSDRTLDGDALLDMVLELRRGELTLSERVFTIATDRGMEGVARFVSPEEVREAMSRDGRFLMALATGTEREIGDEADRLAVELAIGDDQVGE